VAEALREQDAALARLLAGLDARGLWDRTTLFVVSDHGMAEVTESIDVRGPLRQAGIGFDLFPSGGLAQVYLREPRQHDAALAALRGIPGARLVPEPELRERLRAFHPRRSGDFVLVTTPPRTFVEASRIQTLGLLAGRLFGSGSGMHGYDPALPEMSALFLALGRGVTPGERLSVVRAIDLAPTVARLLAIDPPRDAEGSAIALGTRPAAEEQP
jgi:arylsulfatase A-like enzyme